MLKVSTPDGKLTRLVEASQRQEYIDKGWIIEDTSEIEMILDEDGNTMWRYKEDTEWNTIAGGSGGSGVTVYADLNALKAVDTTSFNGGELSEVYKVGIFCFYKNSIQPDNGFTKIRSSTNNGTWICTKRIYKDYFFENSDSSGVKSFYDYDIETGKLAIGGTTDYENGIITTNEMKGDGKLITFDIDKINASCYFVLKANGSKLGASTSYSAIAGVINSGCVISLYDSLNSGQTLIGSTAMPPLGILNTNSHRVSIKVLNNRISVSLVDLYRDVWINKNIIESSIISSKIGNINGLSVYSSGETANTVFSNIEIKDITNIKQIICLGDSQTAGIGVGLNRSWVYEVQKESMYKPVDMINAGVASDTIALMVARLNTDVIAKKSTNTNVTNICIVYAGINDIKNGGNATTAFSALEDMWDTLISNGFNVVAVTLPYLNSGYFNSAVANAEVTTFNNLIKSSIKPTNIIDLNAITTSSGTANYDWALLTSDNIHLSKKTCDLLKNEVLKIL